jgi:hypothetical protein
LIPNVALRGVHSYDEYGAEEGDDQMKKNRHGGNKAQKFALHKETVRRLSQAELSRIAGAAYTSGNTIFPRPGDSICDPCEIAPECA